jgi:uncharacterized protein
MRIVFVAVITIFLGIGAFVWLMKDLEGKTVWPYVRGGAGASSRAFSSRLSPSSDVESPSTATELPRGTVIANGRTIPVDLALDDAEQERGLSYREALPDGEGMLFIFDRAERQTFWMHEMRFPLDIIFISGTRVVRVASDVPAPAPGEYPAIVSSGEAADKVLEINAGKAKIWGIGEGTEIEIVE